MSYPSELVSLVTPLLSDKSAMIKFSLKKENHTDLLKETSFLENFYPGKKIPLKIRCLVVSLNLNKDNFPRCPICNSPVTWDTEYQSSFNQFCSNKCRGEQQRMKRHPKLSDRAWLFEQKVTLGRSYEDIGKELRISPFPVSTVCSEFGIGEKNVIHERPQIGKEELYSKIMDTEKTIEEIAEGLNTSRFLLHQMAREFGILGPDQSFIELRFNCKSSFGTTQQRKKYQSTCLQKYGFPYVPLSHMTRTSKVELQVLEFVKKLLEDDSIKKSRQVLLPELNGEVDIWIPQNSLAIEINGVYWHSNKRLQDKNKHFKKFEILKNKGIQLLQFWDFEIFMKEGVVKSLIAAKCGKSETVIPARKTRLVEVPFQTANLFHGDNHLQGSIVRNQGLYNLGLAYEDELVAVISLGNHHRQVNQTVLSRLTFKQGCMILGGTEKLFKQVISDLEQRPITTFSDNRISFGQVYNRLGFLKDKEIDPDYFWVTKDTIVKKQTGNKYFFIARGGIGNTEVECAESLGYHQVFDAGKVRWKFQ